MDIKKIVLIILGVLSAAGIVNISVFNNAKTHTDIPREISEIFNAWKATHSKVYETEAEHNYRLSIFLKNLDEINMLSQKVSHQVGLNQFSDLTKEEFKKKHTGLVIPADYKPEHVETLLTSNGVRAAAVDHRNKLVGVKNQAQCGSCWAFSTCASLEFAYNNRAGVTSNVSFSEQDLVDCSTRYGNMGCGGGLMAQGFKYIEAKGQETESVYPYTARNGRCVAKAINDVVFPATGNKIHVEKYVSVPANDGEALEAAAEQRVVSIAIDANNIMTYQSGVITDGYICNSTQLDHGVALVGYGTDPRQGDYWIIRNSWGAGWGEEGYFRIKRDTKAAGSGCLGLRLMAGYPVLKE